MTQKRGLLLVVLVLSLVLLPSFFQSQPTVEETPPETPPAADSALPPDQPSPGSAEDTGVARVNEQRYFSLGMVTDDAGGCNDDNIHIDYYDMTPTVTYRECTFNSADTIGETSSYFIISNDVAYSACALNHVDQDGGNNNDCGQLLIRSGVQFGSVPIDLQYTPAGHNNYKYDGGENENTFCKNYYTNGPSYLCSDDHFWHRCSDPEDINTVAWAGNNDAYNCILDPTLNIPVWEKLSGTDLDHDLVPTPGDCEDDPTSGPSLCSEIDFEAPDFNPQNVCTDSRYAACAICINPNAAEVCGDGIDNDCNDDTSDNCHKFPAGCEGTSIAALRGLTAEGVPVGEESETGEVTITDTIEHTNIYDQQFSWTATDEGDGFCCGYDDPSRDDDGLAAVGHVADSQGSQRLCVNKNIVRTENPEILEDPSCDYAGLEGSTGDWCWLTAGSGADFKILTVNLPGEQSYDVVSNSHEWAECKDRSPSSLPEPPPISGSSEDITYDDLLKQSNRFQCYQEGNHWSWAECVPDQAAHDNSGIKGRYEGEGIFSLPLKDGETVKEERVGENIEILAGWYSDYYGEDALLDFTGYSSLNFMVKFVDDAGTSLSAEQLNLPANVYLEIHGPSSQDAADQEQPTIYFQQPVLGYAVSNPLLNGRWINIKVPLPQDYVGVTYLLIHTDNENKIKVRNVYLSKEGNSPLCSGQDATADSSWLADVDDGSGAITGENVCNALYDPEFVSAADYQGKAWLGDDDVVDDTSANCCGNNPHEYYAGPSHPATTTGIDGAPTVSAGISYGCWNSQPIAAGKTTMNVEVKVGYTETQRTITYPTAENVQFTLKTMKYPVVRYACGESGRCPRTISSQNSDGSVSYTFSYDQCTYALEMDNNCSIPLDSGFPTSPFATIDDIPANFQDLAYIQGLDTFINLADQPIIEVTDYFPPINFSSFPQVIGSISLTKADFAIGSEYHGGVLISNWFPQNYLDVYFVNALTGQEAGTELAAADLPSGTTTFKVLAKLKDFSDDTSYQITIA